MGLPGLNRLTLARLSEVTMYSLPSKMNRRRRSAAEMGPPEGGVRRTALRTKVASGFMKIPPPNRCRLEQGSNLQLPSFDRRVYRSNRTLTASDVALVV